MSSPAETDLQAINFEPYQQEIYQMQQKPKISKGVKLSNLYTVLPSPSYLRTRNEQIH